MLRYAVIGVGINVNHASFPRSCSGRQRRCGLRAGASMSARRCSRPCCGILTSEVERLEKAWRGTENGPDLMRRFARSQQLGGGQAGKGGRG